MTKDCVIPAGFAKFLGFAVEHNSKKAIETGKSCQKLSSDLAKRLIFKCRQAGDPKVAGKNKSGGPSKTVESFLKEAYKLSNSQGYLTVADIQKLAGITTLNPNIGSPAFKATIKQLFKSYCVTVDKEAEDFTLEGLSNISEDDLQDIEL